MNMEPSIKDCLYTGNLPERSDENPAKQQPTLDTVNEGLELHPDPDMEGEPAPGEVDRQETGGQQQVLVSLSRGSSDEAGQDLQDTHLEYPVFRTDDRPWGGSRSPLVAAGSREDYDLPPQLMMCRRDSVTFISIPKTFQRGQFERCDTAPPYPEHPLREQKAVLQKSAAIGGLGSLELAPPVAVSRRTSTSHLPGRTRLSVHLDDRLCRSHDDLSTYTNSGCKRRSPLGIPHRIGRSGAGLFIPSLTSLDVARSQTEDEDSFDEEQEAHPVAVRRRRRSSATILHRQSSGITLCVPLQQHSLHASPVETDEEDIQQVSIDQSTLPASTKIVHHRALGATSCSPVRQSSIDELDTELSIGDSLPFAAQPAAPHGHRAVPQTVAADTCEDDADYAVLQDADSHEPSDEAFPEEDPPHSGVRGLHKKGSIAIPLERCLDSFSESYFAVKGAALILPQSECPRTITRGSHGGDIQTHLQSMFYLLRPPDTIKVAVKLESASLTRNRYMAVVSTLGRQDTEESVILGIDIEADKATIGLVLPIWGDTAIALDGDGGFKVTSNERLHIFKPVSVQAMWSALQSVIKARDTAHHHSYYPGGLTHTWVQYYEAHISSNQTALNEWNTMEDIESHRPPDLTQQESLEQVELEKLIKIKLKEIMLTVDLEEVTSKYLRTRLEEEMNMGLKDMRHFIDEEMIVILRQMDSPSQIFPFLFLGSEWNASNLEELQQNGVNQILNVTREIDNFFPGLFDYSNIRVYDIETAELLKHWDNTYRFIKKAESMNAKVLVHCKMGVSRSASSVIAFAMKEYGWSLQEAFEHVKKKRSCIRPNKGFWQQLVTYEGILDASKQRNSKLWRSKSVGDLCEQAQSERSEQEEERRQLDELLDYSGYPAGGYPAGGYPGGGYPGGEASSRPRSWSPHHTHILIKPHNLASDESSDEDTGTHYTELNTMRQEYDGVNATPFLASWDDVDDISSQSMDSLLDTAQETKSVYEGRPQPRVVLLSYRAFSGSDGDHGNLSDGAEVLTEESDVEDLVADECSGRVQRGFYDVQMLTAELLGPADQDEVSNHINYFLHPDYKMDLLMAQQRKHRRVAQLLKLSQPPPDAASLPHPHLADLQPNTTPAALPQVTKLRADNSWIKDVPPSPQGLPQLSDTEEQEGAATPCLPLCEAAPAAAPAPAAAQEAQAESTVAEQVFPEPAATQPSAETVAAAPASDAASTAAQDIGVVQHYQKEDIPWNPGTVKRHKHHLESRLKSKSSRSHSPQTSGSSSDCGSSESLDEIEIVGCSASGDGVVVDIGGVEVGESCTDAPSTECVHTCGAEGAEQLTGLPDALSERPASIYELEDIAVTPGVVQRTKQQIEKRGSVTIQEIDLDYKTVQRSWSMKEDKVHTKRDRTSERRRTCTPVLRTSRSEPDIAGPAARLHADCTVLHIGQDDVTLVQGHVSKHKRAIESRNSKSECDAVMSPESAPDVGSPSIDVSKPRSLSLPVGTEADIPQSSVCKHKRGLECRLSSDGGSPTVPGTSEDTSSTGWSALAVFYGKPAAAAAAPRQDLSPGSGTDGTRGPPGQEPAAHGTADPAVCPADNKVSTADTSPQPGVCSEAADSRVSAYPTADSRVSAYPTADSRVSAYPTADSRVSAYPTADSRVSAYPTADSRVSAYPTADSRVSAYPTADSRVSAYPTEDIPWNVGTVRQQKEAIEKVNAGSATESTRSYTKSPTGGEHDISSEAAGLLRTSSCKTVRPHVVDDSTSGVARSASLKENTVHARTELRVSLSKQKNSRIHVSQKELVMCTSSAAPAAAQPAAAPPDVKKWSDTKQVLIVEAPKPTCKQPAAQSDTTTAQLTHKPPQTPTLKPMEEKTVKDLVDIFDSAKSKDKTSPSEDQTDVDDLLEPQTMSRSKSMIYRPARKDKTKLDRKVSLPTHQPNKGSEDPASAPSKVEETASTCAVDTCSKAGGQHLSADSKLVSPSALGSNRIPISPHREPDPEGVPRKCRRLQGKSHPLSRLTRGDQASSAASSGAPNPIYNTT